MRQPNIVVAESVWRNIINVNNMFIMSNVTT